MSSMLSRSSQLEIRLSDGVPRWSPPREGWLKLNVDVDNFNRNIHMSQVAGGGILRDEKGKWRWAFSCDLGQNINFIAAHLLVIKRGLDLALERRIPMLVLESPCSEAVELIKSQEAIKEGHPLGSIVDECRILARQPWRIEFVHVRRQANKCAQILAEVGLSHFGFIEHDAPPTSKLASVIENELPEETN